MRGRRSARQRHPMLPCAACRPPHLLLRALAAAAAAAATAAPRRRHCGGRYVVHGGALGAHAGARRRPALLPSHLRRHNLVHLRTSEQLQNRRCSTGLLQASYNMVLGPSVTGLTFCQV